MVKKGDKQYTIRQVPERLDQRIREAADEYGMSLNAVALQAMGRGLGLEEVQILNHDLDDLAGTWVQDDGFDRAMRDMDQVDPGMWT
ncbi:MAG: hypothetical protein O3C57_08330 [Verrucomicrobia bacterium]|nr:hypothetical protein [Verrucomicrobiota bacterium]